MSTGGHTGDALAGVDGCKGGWLAVWEMPGQEPDAFISTTFAELVGRLPQGCRIGVDIPIGLRDCGARDCDLQARQLLGHPRRSSVFLAPPRAVLGAADYPEACALHLRTEGKKMSLQAYYLLPKIREVDVFLTRTATWRDRIAEVHPEVSFTHWNDGAPMTASKKTPEGRRERRALIDRAWPGAVDRFRSDLKGSAYAMDDLHDAFAVLWTARRWAAGRAMSLGDPQIRDRMQRRMQILA